MSPDRSQRSAARVALPLVLASLPLGAAAGLAWLAWAPRVLLEVRGDQVVPAGYQPDEFLAADATLALLLAGCGLLVGVVATWRCRHRPLAVLVGGVVGGVLGSLLAWGVGTWLGGVDVEALAAAGPDGATFDGPLRLRLPGVLLLWPVVVAAVVTVVALWDAITAWQEDRDED